MLRESNRPRDAWSGGHLGPSRVRVGSTRAPLGNRKGLGVFVAISAAAFWFGDAGRLKDNPRIRRVPGEAGHRTSLFAISADGSRIATTDLGGSIALREAQKGWMIEEFPGSPGYLRSISLSPDGRFLACTGLRSGVTVYDLRSRVEARRLPVPLDRPRVVAYSPDGRTIAVTTDRDGQIVLWDLAAGRVVRSLLAPGPAVSLAFSSDGHTLASGGFDRDSTVLVWDLDTGQSRRLIGRNRGPIVALALSHDGRWLASASGHEREVRLRDLKSGDSPRSIEGHAHGTTSAAFSPDGTTLATAGNDGMVRLWAVATGRAEMALDGDAIAMGHVAYSPDGHQLAATSRDDHDLRVWELAEALAVRPTVVRGN